MKNAIITIALGIFLLGSVMAFYSGEDIEFDFSDKLEVIDNITYEVVENTSSMEGLEVFINIQNVTIKTSPYFDNNYFKIIFTIKGQNEEVVVPVSSGGSGHGGGMFGKKYQQTNITNESVEDNINDTTDEVVQTDIVEVVEDKNNKGWQILAAIVGLVILIVVGLSLRGKK